MELDINTAHPDPTPTGKRFLKIADAADTLSCSEAQIYALVRSGEIPAIKIGGRGQWRIEASVLEQIIQDMYHQTRQFVADHPYGAAAEAPLPTEPD